MFIRSDLEEMLLHIQIFNKCLDQLHKTNTCFSNRSVIHLFDITIDCIWNLYYEKLNNKKLELFEKYQ